MIIKRASLTPKQYQQLLQFIYGDGNTLTAVDLFDKQVADKIWGDNEGSEGVIENVGEFGLYAFYGGKEDRSNRSRIDEIGYVCRLLENEVSRQKEASQPNGEIMSRNDRFSVEIEIPDYIQVNYRGYNWEELHRLKDKHPDVHSALLPLQAENALIPLPAAFLLRFWKVLSGCAS